MTDHVERLRAAYLAWDRSKGLDVAPWADLVADHVAVVSAGSAHPGLAFAKPRKTKAELLLYLAEITADWDMIYFRAESLTAEGDRVAMFGRCAWRHKKTGKVADTPISALWRFENGLAVEFIEIFDTATAGAAASP